MTSVLEQLTLQYAGEEYANIRFKSCGELYLVVLELLEDSITNEARKVFDTMHAKYRADKMRVVSIVNKITGDTNMQKVYSDTKELMYYLVGEIVTCVKPFCNDIKKICASGIHYFKSVEAAFWYNWDVHYDGNVKFYSDNGKIREQTQYIMGKKCGESCKYVEGLLTNSRKYENGKLISSTHYTYWQNKTMKSSQEFDSDERIMSELTWYESGVLASEMIVTRTTFPDTNGSINAISDDGTSCNKSFKKSSDKPSADPHLHPDFDSDED
jgi:hypothetical protein